jgi:hypothetical protein
VFVRLDYLRALLAVLLVVRLGAAPASPAIGTIVTNGAFRLNNATVISNATLFEGATVETGAAVSRMDLSSGTRLEMGSESKGRVFGDHLALERGQSRIDKASGFRIEARGLTILPGTGGSTGRVVLAGNTRVQVAALTGVFRVLNSQGMVVANIPAGTALALELKTAGGEARLTGRLVNRGGHYLLKDETTQVTVEVHGPGLAGNTGRVEVTGFTEPAATPVSDATQVIQATRVMQAPAGTAAPSGGAGGGAAPAGAGGSGGATGTAGGAAGSKGLSVTVIAIIGGVAAAAVVGGLAASGNFGGGAAAPVSR